MMDSLESFLLANQELIGVAIFIITFIECLAVVGLAIPGVSLLVIASVVAGKMAFPLVWALLLGFVAGLFAEIISYGIGRRFKDRVYSFTILQRHPKWIDRAEQCFVDYGSVSVLVGRFITPVRPVLPMMAGVFGLPFIHFLFASFFASIVWSVVFIIPAWTAGAAFILPVGKQFWFELGSIVIVLAAAIAVGVYGCLKQKRWIALYMGCLGAFLFAVLYFALPYLNALDQGLLLVSKTARSLELDTIIVFVTELGDYKQQFIVSAVLCFLLLFMRQIKALVFFASTMMGTAVIGWIIKETVARVRPDALAEVLPTFSFPSGHTSASFAFFLSLGVLAGLGRSPRARVLWLFIVSFPAILIALSRIYLGVHWGTDIVAGGLLASSICMFSLAWVQLHGDVPALPKKCWKILLPIALFVIVVSAICSFPHAYSLYTAKSIYS